MASSPSAITSSYPSTAWTSKHLAVDPTAPGSSAKVALCGRRRRLLEARLVFSGSSSSLVPLSAVQSHHNHLWAKALAAGFSPEVTWAPPFLDGGV